MAITTRILSLSRSLFTPPLLSRSFTTTTTTRSLSLLRPLVAAPRFGGLVGGGGAVSRGFSTRRTQSSLQDSNPNWTNRPPKETILLDGCDFNHWLVVMEKPDEGLTRDEICDLYVRTLAKVVGRCHYNDDSNDRGISWDGILNIVLLGGFGVTNVSIDYVLLVEEEARHKIYSVSTRCYYAFGALVDEELSYKLKAELEGVRWVLPDSYLDVRNKDYGGEPFIDGRPVPYDPKYHEEWERNNAKAMERNRRNDRPRSGDRARNFERRRQNMQNPDFQRGPSPYHPLQQNVAPNNAVPPSPQYNAPNNAPPQYSASSNAPPQYNATNAPNMGGIPQNNMNGAPNFAGHPPNHMQGTPQNNMGNAPNMGGPPNPSAAPYRGPMPPPNMGGGPNAGWQGNMPNANASNVPNFQNDGGMQHQNGQMAHQGQAPNYLNNYAPNDMRGPPVGNTYNTRDLPPPPPDSYQ
ncbi:Multiple organellar RNA editing factor 8, chloroplastic/mitochondrial-like protein [Drosera capensis]